MDLPTCLYYEELMEHFPDAKVILNVRDSERWYRSWERINDGIRFMQPFARISSRVRRALDITDLLVRDGHMGGVIEKEKNIAIFERHNREVVERVPEDRLLVFDVREGWEPLCAFLGVDVPDEPFPHLNETKGSMRKRLVEYWVETTSTTAKTGWALGGAVAIAMIAMLAF